VNVENGAWAPRRIGRAVTRVLSSVLLVALFAATSAAFVLTEAAKLEKSPIYGTSVTKLFSPTCNCKNDKALIDFWLRKSEHVSAWLEYDGKRVRTLVPGRRYARGPVRLSFNGISPTGLTLPDGVYLPFVHLGSSHRTIGLPNPIRLDTKPPVVQVRQSIHAHISPDGDGRNDVFRILYRVSKPSHGILFVDGRLVEFTYWEPLRGVLVWNGKIDDRLASPGKHVLEISAQDLAGNRAKPFPFAVVTIRYLALGRNRLLVRPGARFSILALTDASTVTWLLHGRHGKLPRGRLHLRAPKRPGLYRLYVQAAGHSAKALIIVA
jgi:hypothetical protein